MTDLEREAREAYGNFPKYPTSDQVVSMDGFVSGYLAAAEPREKRIAELRTSLMLIGANFDSAVKRIAELEAKVAAVPVAAMKELDEWELGLDYPCEAAAVISEWLVGLAK